MDLQKYRLFVDLAETGNLTRTGERMGYTQSGVSRFLKNMEQELGFPLFTRTRRGLTLTAAGQILLPSARALLKSGEKLEQTVRELNGVETGIVVVGAFEEISVRILPELLREFWKESPNIMVKVREGDLEEIRSWMQNGTVDFGLCTQCVQMTWYPLWEERLLAVTDRRHPWKEGEGVSLRALREQPTILLAQEDGASQCQPLKQFQEGCQVRGETKSGYAALSMIRSGLGCGVLPEMVLAGSEGSVSALPLEPPVARMLGVCAPSESDIAPAAQQLIACIRRVAGAMKKL